QEYEKITMKYYIINLQKHFDSRGKLIVCENGIDCPFEIKRVFLMYENDPKAIRGAHSNQKSQFLLMAIKGKCRIKVADGEHSCSFTLDTPEKALYLDKMVWKEISDFSKDAVLLVLSSEKYDPDEYVNQ
ncbi:MAG: FdtA/QdtA family cupin domain-containing protein, partial [Holosporaceae bacterium]|nr:FdtA/QdtA family cupin domain-containing protein [Holosporaceae bacterium]